MLAHEFQLRSKLTEGSLYAITVGEPEPNNLHHYAHHHLQLSCTEAAVFVAERLQILETLLAALGWANVEQWLAVLALSRARMNLKFYSIGLAWHNIFLFWCKVTAFSSIPNEKIALICKINTSLTIGKAV
jgi:hypothetical protein